MDENKVKALAKLLASNPEVAARSILCSGILTVGLCTTDGRINIEERLRVRNSH